jgi:hypothetical protein
MLIDDGLAHVRETAPGHVEEVRAAGAYLLAKAQARQLGDIGRHILRVIDSDDPCLTGRLPSHSKRKHHNDLDPRPGWRCPRCTSATARRRCSTTRHGSGSCSSGLSPAERLDQRVRITHRLLHDRLLQALLPDDQLASAGKVRCQAIAFDRKLLSVRRRH